MKYFLIVISLLVGWLFSWWYYSPSYAYTDYFLEVHEDYVILESVHGRVYSGSYSDIDSLVLVDNL